MKLSDIEVQAAYYGVAHFIRARKMAGQAIPPEITRLVKRLDAHVRLSSTRPETGCGTVELTSSNVWLGANAVASLLGENIRWVQRHAHDIGGQLNGGRWFFRESDVIDFHERRAHARTDT